MSDSFSLTGPLPNGTVLLEASAGTGKTFTLASLAVRYLAEGLATLDDLLLITFSRMATAELRARVRSRLAEAIACLDPDTSIDSSTDEMLAQLTAVNERERQTRLGRLRQAAADLDSATIATTHEFCQRMLFSLGVLADMDASPQFVADPKDLVSEATADAYVRQFGDRSPPFPYASTWGEKVPATRFAADVVREPAALIVPESATGTARARVEFASEVRAEVELRKRRRRLFTYDDQLVKLRDALNDPVTGELARQRLAQRYRTVLVDEFQDTDPIQWEILSRTFHGQSTLVLIGDPKQAIYGFRGADIGTYHAAASVASRTVALTTNYRTDATLVEALDQLLAGADLGEGIEVPPVTSAHRERRIASTNPTQARPLRIRGVPPQARELTRSRATQIIVTDLVAEIANLLSGDVTVTIDGQTRPLRPHDIAVLVRTNRIGRQSAGALRSAGIAAAVSGSDSLFSVGDHPNQSPAHNWLTLLTALADPRGPLIRDAALTPFLGWSPRELADAEEASLGELRETVHAWSRVWQAHGTAAVWESIVARPDFASGVRSRPDGNRLLADLRRVAMECELAEHHGVATLELTDWLRTQMRDLPDVHHYLASDEEAVQVLTIHRSKGLEFPLVLLPDLAMRPRWAARGDETIVFHDEQHRRCVDVGGRSAPGRQTRVTMREEESDAETLRDLYVAMTRAQLGVIAWWVPEKSTPQSPLHRVLARPANTAKPARSYELNALAVRSDRPAVSFEAFSPDVVRPVPTPTPPTALPTDAHVRTFTRAIDPAWRRTSYSGLTASAHGVTFESLSDEPSEAESAGSATETTSVQAMSSSETISPFLGLPRGAEFGTLVHAAFEETDFAAPNLTAAVSAVTERLCPRSAVDVNPSQLTKALDLVLRTSLGDLAAGRDLTAFSRKDRLDELAFDLPLGGEQSATLAAVADLLEKHLDPEDPLASYPTRLRELSPSTLPLRGVLTGSIDAVLRLKPENRFVVVDYKTNQLGDESQRISQYSPGALASAMIDNHYPLQAILYCVALHRYLRWRLPDYEPGRHLGGVGYLFVRGMAGPDTVGSPGVFTWRPSANLVTSLSDLLAGSGGAAS